ncbi:MULTISPECIES: hypothetical protein [Calothrix]|nr:MULTISPECIES: hypothetical protein [Calothrix]
MFICFFVNRQPSTVNRQPSTVNRQPSTINPICKSSAIFAGHIP